MNYEHEIEEMMKKIENVVDILTTKIVDLEKIEKENEENVVKATEKLDATRKELHEIKDRKDSLVMSLESMKMGGFVAHVDAKPIEILPEKVEEKIPVVKPVKQIAWKHAKPFIIKLNEFDNIEDRYSTQGRAAKKLDVSPSTIFNWLKKPKEWMLKKYGFYLVWEF